MKAGDRVILSKAGRLAFPRSPTAGVIINEARNSTPANRLYRVRLDGHKHGQIWAAVFLALDKHHKPTDS